MRSMASVAALCACIVAGCVAHHPRDLALVSVEAVDNREVAEIGTPDPTGRHRSVDPYRLFLEAVRARKGPSPITPEDMEPYFRQAKGTQWFRDAKEKAPRLKITFTTEENLLEYMKRRETNVAFRAFHCGRGTRSIASWGGSVYTRGLNISFGRIEDYAIDLEEGERLNFYSYLSLSYDHFRSGVRKQFDWRRTPEDVCFDIHGGWLDGLYKSNIVVIPAAEIAKALNALPPALRAGSSAR